MQSANIPNQNQISTHNDSCCKCEDDEMDHTGVKYRSNYERQLQQSEVITEAISHTQPPALQYRQTHGIQNMETDAIDYSNSQAIQHT